MKYKPLKLALEERSERWPTAELGCYIKQKKKKNRTFSGPIRGVTCDGFISPIYGTRSFVKGKR